MAVIQQGLTEVEQRTSDLEQHTKEMKLIF